MKISAPDWFPKNPEYVWKHFYELTQIPRPSKDEGKVVDYLIKIAEEYSLDYKVDDEKNVIIYVPASEGFEGKEPIIIQGHVDMVTDATPDREIDFHKDPIRTKIDGDWLSADRTTLGADNGIGCAMALACITDKSINHPELELLFTTDEETGLNGAWGVQGKYLKGRKLINLDTEEWGSAYVGCAGGIDYEFYGSFHRETPRAKEFYKITLGGLTGGHSGLDIHLQLGNAIKILGEFLLRYAKSQSIEISDFQGGKAHNIIPRDAWAIIGVDNLEHFVDSLDGYTEKIFSYLPKRDHELEFSVEKVDVVESTMNSVESLRFLSFLNLFPHGAYNYEFPLSKELVSASNNLAKFIFNKGELYVQTSLRFFDREEIKMLEDKLESLASLFSLECRKNSEYPSWKPHWDTPLLDTVKSAYKDIFSEDIKVKAIHAGLECGILKSRISQDLDAISFGPDITGAHSPDERVFIPSVEKCWKLLQGVLEKT